VTTTLIRSKREENGAGLRLDPIRRRRPLLALGSVALLVISISIFVGLYAKAGGQHPVLAIARPVPEGAIVQSADLMMVRVSVNSSVVTVPASSANIVVGLRAAEPLQPHTLLVMNDLVTTFSPPVGESIVGVSLKEGQLPASGVAPGETVDIVATGFPDQSPSDTDGSSYDQEYSPGAVLAPSAVVLDESPATAASGGANTDVSLLTTSTLAPLVASAAASGEVALVVTSPGS
jgi:hypothetical protein